MLTIRYGAEFRRDYKRLKRRGYDMGRINRVIGLLANQDSLPPQLKDHAFTGNYSGFRECHIMPDWLLIYQIIGQELILVLSRTDTHSDLFGK